MEWVLKHFGGVIAFVVFTMVVRGVLKVLRPAGDAQQKKGGPAEQDTEAAERTRRVQEEIRKKIAERRAAMAGEQAPSRPSPRPQMPPLVRPISVPQLDPFGGPMRRAPRQPEPEVVRRFEPEPEPEPETDAETTAVLVRQQKLAEQLRTLEEARRTQQRRAVVTAGERTAERAAYAGAMPVRHEVTADLRDPRALRRAIVLREVLGTPVGLR